MLIMLDVLERQNMNKLLAISVVCIGIGSFINISVVNRLEKRVTLVEAKIDFKECNHGDH